MGLVEKLGVRKTCFVCVTFMNDAITTKTTLIMFCIIYLIRYPQAQTRMRKQIHDVVGDSALVSQKWSTRNSLSPNTWIFWPWFKVTLEHRDQLSFTEAFLCEVLRIVSPISTSVPNRPLKTTTFRGYRIPKSYNVMYNIIGIHMDPQFFPNPTQFRPERFLMEDGKFKRIEQFMPFGTGKNIIQ